MSLNYQSQDVQVSLTYQLEREDADVMKVVSEKAAEVAEVHRMAWQRMCNAKLSAGGGHNTHAKAKSGSPEDERQEAPPMEAATAVAEGETEPEDPEPSTPGQQAALRALLAHVGWSEEQIKECLTARFGRSRFGCSGLKHLTQRQASGWLLELQREEREKAHQRRQNTTRFNGKSL